MKSCRIVTSPINSGKTTYISKLIKECGDKCGFISAKDDIGYSLVDINTGKTRRFLSTFEEFSSRYKRWYIDYSAFDWVYSSLCHVEDKNVFLDEVGMLEVEEKGYFRILKRLMDTDIDLTITVRQEFVPLVVAKFSFPNVKVVEVPFQSNL